MTELCCAYLEKNFPINISMIRLLNQGFRGFMMMYKSMELPWSFFSFNLLRWYISYEFKPILCFFFFKLDDFVSTWFRSSSWNPSGAIWGLWLGGCCFFFWCLHSRSKIMVLLYIHLVLMMTWCIKYCSTLCSIYVWGVFSQVQGLFVKKEKGLMVYQCGEWFMESAIAVWA